MTLTARIAAGNGSRPNRERQQRAERRLDEIVSVAGIADDYAAEDRRGDAAIETHFRQLYQLVDSAEEKQAIAAAYVVWQRTEAAEDRAVIRSVSGSVQTLKANNPFWLGASVPEGSDGAA